MQPSHVSERHDTLAASLLTRRGERSRGPGEDLPRIGVGHRQPDDRDTYQRLAALERGVDLLGLVRPQRR